MFGARQTLLADKTFPPADCGKAVLYSDVAAQVDDDDE